MEFVHAALPFRPSYGVGVAADVRERVRVCERVGRSAARILVRSRGGVC